MGLLPRFHLHFHFFHPPTRSFHAPNFFIGST